MHLFTSHLLCSVALFFLMLVETTFATVTRTAEACDSGAVRVCLTWSFESVPTSAIVISETVPIDWTVDLSPESEQIVDAVRSSDDTVDFIIGLHVQTATGSMTYDLVPAVAEAKTLPLAGAYSLTEGISVARYAISGTQSCVSSVPGSGGLSDASPLKIVSFAVTEGESPRVTIAWTGTENGQDVHVEWCSVSSLKAEKTTRRGMEVASETETSGWAEFWHVDTSSPSGGLSLLSQDADGTSKGVYQVTPDKEAQPGFYRLRVVE